MEPGPASSPESSLANGWRLPDADLVGGFTRGPRLAGYGREEQASIVVETLPGVSALRWCRQVHGSDVHVVVDPSPGVGEIGRGDAVISTTRGVAVAVWSADCVPVLLATDGAVAAVHSGWRGTVAGVVLGAVAALERLSDDRARPVRAWLGPAIGICCYEVGDEVIDGLRARGHPERLWRRDRHVDLRSVIEADLRRAGIASENIARLGPCTACDPRAASYRRDGSRAGRQLSFIGRPAGTPGDAP